MTVKNFLKESGIKKADRLDNWNGYAVYEPDRKQFGHFSGPPLYILHKNDEVRFTSYEEGMAIYDEELRKNGYVYNEETEEYELDDSDEMKSNDKLTGLGENE